MSITPKSGNRLVRIAQTPITRKTTDPSRRTISIAVFLHGGDRICSTLASVAKVYPI
jgi:hypothetical protein